MNLQDLKYTVVGLGMLGGSYALAIKEKINPLAIYGIDNNQDTINKAEKKGIIANKRIDEILKDTDVLILAVYPSIAIEFLKTNQKYLKTNSIVTDVCGVKSSIITEISSFLRDDLDFIAGHPMAGNQYMGFDNSDIEIFLDKNYIIVPQEKNKDENIKLVEELAFAIGFSSISKVDMETHDKKIAYASHMMHFISVCVTNSDTFDIDLDTFAGGSFKDLTRIADINPYLWSETFFLNKKYILEELELFRENIDYLASSLEEDNYDKVFDFLEKSRRRKSNKNIN